MVRVAIIGAGPAGCLTARRLADAGHQVTLYEAGERVAPTLDFASLLDRPDLRWAQLPNTAHGITRARAVGGGAAINAMLLSAPDRVDLAGWEASLGLSAGSARSSLERVIAEIAPQIAAPGPFARSLSQAAIGRGDGIGGSTLDVDASGVLAAALAARSGQRRDPMAVYLDGAPDQLQLVAGTTVTSLDPAAVHRAASDHVASDRAASDRVASDRAASDRAARGRVAFDPAALDHVVVSAGALASPELLASVVPRLVAAPAQHHLAVALSIPLGPGQRVERDQPAVSRVVRWSSGLDPTEDRNDMQLVILDHMGWEPAGRSHGLVIISLLSASCVGAPTADLDRARLRHGVRRALELLDAGGFAPIDGSVMASAREDAALDRWVAAQRNPVHHVTSTLPLGPDLDRAGLVGPAGLVAGRDDLSVIDASVFPNTPRADTNMPVLVMADLLATQLVDHLT